MMVCLVEIHERGFDGQVGHRAPARGGFQPPGVSRVGLDVEGNHAPRGDAAASRLGRWYPRGTVPRTGRPRASRRQAWGLVGVGGRFAGRARPPVQAISLRARLLLTGDFWAKKTRQQGRA
jgi:hypothetical protein